MISFDISKKIQTGKGNLAKVTSLFFDRKTVIDYLDKRTRTVFARFGAYVRKAAQWSIRPAPKDKWSSIDGRNVRMLRTSRPGDPPYSRTGLLKRFIYYSLDPSVKSVVIGPVRLSKGTISVPSVLEYGGISEAYDPIERKFRKVHIAPRPYMHPAFEKGKQQLGRLWRESIR